MIMNLILVHWNMIMDCVVRYKNMILIAEMKFKELTLKLVYTDLRSQTTTIPPPLNILGPSLSISLFQSPFWWLWSLTCRSVFLTRQVVSPQDVYSVMLL
jgi:hypothetical protein